jgi:hypothetical protein
MEGPAVSELLDRAVSVHGGLDRADRFQQVSADVAIGGALWRLKGRPERTNVHVTVDLHQERAVFAPFKLPNHYAVFTPHRLTVETNPGVVVEERTNPRAAFAGHTRETPWDDLDQLYFSGYAMWTYLTVPFCLTWPGFEVAEIEPWQEQDETWRRLAVTFPGDIASHSRQQTFYFGADGLLRRHDYDVEVAGGFPAAHYVSDYQNVSGLLMATKRRVFPRQPDNLPDRTVVTIAIDLEQIRFG